MGLPVCDKSKLEKVKKLLVKVLEKTKLFSNFVEMDLEYDEEEDTTSGYIYFLS